MNEAMQIWAAGAITPQRRQRTVIIEVCALPTDYASLEDLCWWEGGKEGRLSLLP